MDSSRSSFPVVQALALLATALVVLAAGAIFVRAYASREINREHERKVVEAPLESLQLIQEEQRARLEGYRWIDQEQGRVSLPIERAMELVVQEQGGSE